MTLLIVPKKWALHSVSLYWILPYLYLTYFHSTSYQNEWISSTMTNISKQALKAGFSVGECCSIDDFQSTTSEVFSNIGFIIIGLIAGWAIYGLINVFDNCCKGSLTTVISFIWYYLLTIHFITFIQIVYFATYALANYQLNNEKDAINITFSLFFTFSIIFFVISLWHLTSINRFYGSEDDLASNAATRNTIEKE